MKNLQVGGTGLAEKAVIDSTSLPNSTLSYEQAEAFIDLVVDQSVLLKNVRVERTSKSHGTIIKLDLGTIVTEGAAAVSCPRIRVPSETTADYATEKYRSAFDISSDYLEDNPEGTGVTNRIINMFVKGVSNNSEMAAIRGDDSLVTGDNESDENNLLGVNDGWMKILEAGVPAGQVVDAAGAGASDFLFYTMKRRIPSKFSTSISEYVWIVSPGIADTWIREVQDRPTALGDLAWQGKTVPGPWGLRMLTVPLMPETLTYGTAGTDGTQIWLTPLQNLVYVVQRDIKIEEQRNARADLNQITIHFRVDFLVEDEDMVVVAKNVALAGTAYA